MLRNVSLEREPVSYNNKITHIKKMCDFIMFDDKPFNLNFLLKII